MLRRQHSFIKLSHTVRENSSKGVSPVSKGQGTITTNESGREPTPSPPLLTTIITRKHSHKHPPATNLTSTRTTTAFLQTPPEPQTPQPTNIFHDCPNPKDQSRSLTESLLKGGLSNSNSGFLETDLTGRGVPFSGELTTRPKRRFHKEHGCVKSR